MPKEEILDPAGKVIDDTLQNLGYDNISNINLGKCIEMKMVDTPDIRKKVEEICKKVLANELTENFYYSVLY